MRVHDAPTLDTRIRDVGGNAIGPQRLSERPQVVQNINEKGTIPKNCRWMPCYHTPYVRIKSRYNDLEPSPTELADTIAFDERTRRYPAEQKQVSRLDYRQLVV